MKKTVLGIAVITLLVGCHTKKNIVADTARSVSNTTQIEAPSENAFAFALLQRTIQEENVFLSPSSAAMALSMLTPGAGGQTAQELKSVVPNVQLTNTEQLQSASAIWLNEGFAVKPAFLKANAEAEVYAGPISAKKVNAWASEHTNGKVDKVLQDPLPRYEMILTNALWFKAQWQHTFKSTNTDTDTFFGTNATTQVSMMHQTAHFHYMENNLFQAIRMDYTSPYCMDIVLPRPGKTISEIVGEIKDLNMDSADYKKVALSLPKVQLEYERTLNADLKSMGLSSCFSRSANFSYLSDTPIYVDMVKQNTFLAIDEEGTEAAAVTTILMANMAMPVQEQIYEMKINRPFVLFIRETENNRILFFGIINHL